MFIINYIKKAAVITYCCQNFVYYYYILRIILNYLGVLPEASAVFKAALYSVSFKGTSHVHLLPSLGLIVIATETCALPPCAKL